MPPVRYAHPSYRARVITYYIANHYVKILHVPLGVANNMHPLSWGGGGHKRKRSELYNVIDKLPQNKASGFGFLPSWIFKCCKIFIRIFLEFAIHDGISNNVFPDVLKSVCNSNLYKVDPLDSKNYRPISVASTLAKSFERLLLQQTLEYNKPKIISLFWKTNGRFN